MIKSVSLLNKIKCLEEGFSLYLFEFGAIVVAPESWYFETKYFPFLFIVYPTLHVPGLGTVIFFTKISFKGENSRKNLYVTIVTALTLDLNE